MNRLTRWQPARREMMSLREAMDRLFDDAFTRPLNMFDGWDTPLVDLYETQDDVVVKATLPGIDPDDLNITISNDVLTIQGETEREEEIDEGSYHLREQHYGTLSRSLQLPTTVNADEAHAEFKNGILTLTIPKVEEARPKVIEIQSV
jgi:HSP20 family protein